MRVTRPAFICGSAREETSLSSILKALKKVEESGQAEANQDSPPLMYGAASSRSSWRQKIWRFGQNRVYFLMLVVGLAVAGAAYYWWSAGGVSPPSAGPAKEVRAQLPQRAAESPPQAVSPPVRTAQPKPTPPPGQTPETATGSVQAPPPTSRVRPREVPASPPPEPRSSPARGPQSSPERVDTSRPSPPRAAEDNLSRLDESKLKVMAIAWTAEPSRRLAVVNGHIVKEGESVEGFNVTQIRKDDIIVNDGGRSWKVELNLKSQQ